MFAARAFDPTIHGGFIAFGEPTVLIGGLPAARIGDPHICPLTPPLLPPHVGGWISSGSMTVLIGGQGAARQTDLCACCVAPVSLPSVSAAPPGDALAQTAIGPYDIELGYGRGEDRFYEGEGRGSDHKREHAAVRITTADEILGFIRHERDTRIMYEERTYTKRDSEIVPGMREHTGGKIEAGAVRDRNTYSVFGGEYPGAVVETTGKVASGEATKAEVLIGSDGKGRYGLGGEIGAKGSGASSGVKVTSDAAFMPLLTPVALAARKYAGVNAETTGAFTVAGGGVGAVGGGWLYYEDGRLNWGLKGRVELGVGVSFELGASVGVLEDRKLLDYFRDDPVEIDPALVALLIDKAKAAYAAHLLAVVPNTIAMGCPTVLIGG